MWYTTGKITVTNKSATVTATGTQWSVSRYGVLPGMVFIGPDGKLYEIQRVDSDTSLTLSTSYSGPTAKDQAYAIITTYEGDLTQFSAKFSNLLASFGGSRQDLLSWLTDKGDVIITQDDGSKLTVPSLNKINDSLSGTVKESSRAVVVPAVVSGTGNYQGYLKLATLPITSTGVNGVHFMVAAGRTYGTPGMDIKFVQFSARNASTTALDSRGLKVASLGPVGQDVKFGAIYNAQTARWELWMLGPAYSMPSVSILASSSSNAMSGIELLKDNTWQKTKPDGFTPVAEDKIYSGYNVTVDGNGFLKAASPIARLTGAPEKMADDYLDGFTLAGSVAVNSEAAGVTAERVSVGVYKITGSSGFAEEGWSIEVPQDVNGNRLCFVETSTGKDGTIYVKVSKRRFDIDTAAIVAGEPMDIPDGRWIDLRLEMPVRGVVEEPIPDVQELLTNGPQVEQEVKSRENPA
ncbi:hypothetical protein [Serratia liquefaciens]|uniref:phage tail fiber protein n=1 Tax=Serratia liquefaciens TaxID=614 RepID=UPI0022B94EC9|nr:hypothetical protein [Serratia liquefaciens]